MMGHGILDIWMQMGFLAKSVAIFLILMSVYSLGLFIERLMLFRAAKKQSIEYLPVATKALKEGRYKDAVEAARRYNKSHLAKVLSAGLQQFLFEKEEQPTHDAIESVRLAVERAAALTTAARQGVMPASPPPFTRKGLPVVGSSVSARVKSGSSSARGTA